MNCPKGCGEMLRGYEWGPDAIFYHVCPACGHESRQPSPEPRTAQVAVPRGIWKGIAKNDAGMNKTEVRYADQLEAQKMAGSIRDWWFESMRLKIAHDCWYLPDYVVLNSDYEIELHEVKGHMRDDALVKLKAVADKYPFRVYVVKWVGGQWETKEVMA